jgi:hypothetical protein
MCHPQEIRQNLSVSPHRGRNAYFFAAIQRHFPKKIESAPIRPHCFTYFLLLFWVGFGTM